MNVERPQCLPFIVYGDFAELTKKESTFDFSKQLIEERKMASNQIASPAVKEAIFVRDSPFRVILETKIMFGIDLHNTSLP